MAEAEKKSAVAIRTKVVKTKPTSPGRRSLVKIVNPELSKERGHKSLRKAKSRTGGRGNTGRITVRHIGGGHKQQYRLIDFKRNSKEGIVGRVESLHYDPNRTANIAQLVYTYGERRNIIAPKDLH